VFNNETVTLWKRERKQKESVSSHADWERKEFSNPFHDKFSHFVCENVTEREKLSTLEPRINKGAPSVAF